MSGDLELKLERRVKSLSLFRSDDLRQVPDITNKLRRRDRFARMADLIAETKETKK